MTDPYRELEHAYLDIARKPLPHPWLSEPVIAAHKSVTGILDAIRADTHNPASHVQSDDTIRALARLGRHDPHARIVLLHALAAEVRRRLGRATTSEYRADVLADLAIVVLEADDLDQVDRLATRLANRAHNRAHKRSRRVRTRGERHPTTIDPCPPERLTRLHDSQSHSDGVAELATTRAALDQFHASIRHAIATGELPETIWTRYRDGKLARAVHSGLPATTARQRTETHRAGRRLKTYIDAHLIVHAD